MESTIMQTRRTSKAVGCRGFPRHRRIFRGILPTQEYRVMEVGIARMVVIHGDLPVVEDCKGNGHIGAQEFYRRVSPGSSGEVSDHQGEGLSGMKDVREPIVRVSKNL